MRKAVLHLKKSDPTMRSIIDAVGPCLLQYREPTFPLLVSSISSQQISGKAARTIYGRLVDACGPGGLTPEAVLRLRPDRMRKAGLSKGKTEYIRDLARHTRSGSVIFEQLPGLGDDAVIEHLVRVKGVGVWTAQVFLMFALQRQDVLPTGDLGIRAAMRKAYALEELPKPKEMEAIAESWRPYRTVACWYLWRSLDGQAGF